MAMLSLTNFDPQIADLQRQQQLAQMLAQQTQDPLQSVGSYGGVPAPISPLQGLAKLLQTYAVINKGKQLAKEQADITSGQRQEALDAIAKLNAPTQSDLTQAPTAIPGMSDHQGLLDALKSRLGLSSSPSSPSMAQGPAVAAPTPLPPSATPPAPTGALLGAAMGAPAAASAVPPPQGVPAPPSAPGALPPGVTPMPPPQSLPQGASEGVPLSAPPDQPVQRIAPPITEHQTTPQDRQQMALEAMVSGNPYLKDVAPTIYQQATQQVQAQRIMDAMSGPGGPGGGLPDAQKTVFLRHAMAGDLKGAVDALDKFSEPRVVGHTLQQLNPATGQYDTIVDARDHWSQVQLPPEAQKLLPPGSVVLQSSTGDMKTVKLSDAESAAKFSQDLTKIGIEQRPAWANVALSGQRLGLEQQRFAWEKQGGVYSLPADQQQALNQAYADKRLDPMAVNGRNMHQIAQALVANPQLNAMALHGIAAGTANPLTQRNIANLSAIPDIVQNVSKAGTALNMSPVQFLGKVQAWQKGQLNDPQFTNYMTQRKDAILSLAQAFRGASATDQATKLEEEAFKPTLSPQALQGWLQGQLTSALPRMESQVPYDAAGVLAPTIARVKGMIGPGGSAPAKTQSGATVSNW